uniref:Uncharacterized protein n=1 Tax=Panagrolaimus sp. PS1159 TaxID=55785 RepID=A0AC35F8I7_9BILA
MKWSISEDDLITLKHSGNFRSNYFTAYDAEYYLAIFPNEDEKEKCGETWIYLFFEDGSGELVKPETKYNIKIESANFVSDENTLFQDKYFGTRICTTEEFFDPEKDFIVNGK